MIIKNPSKSNAANSGEDLTILRKLARLAHWARPESESESDLLYAC